ncbi:MAG TPA: hypothetical protein VH397_20365 [Xanthobacteraceae bacterium]
MLRQFGEEDYHPGQKDYFLLDENLGLWQHKIETNNLEMVRLIVIESLRRLLQGYPNWEIAIALASPDMENVWPAMGLVIRDDEIIHGLQGNIFQRSFRRSRTREAGRRDRASAISSIRSRGRSSCRTML